MTPPGAFPGAAMETLDVQRCIDSTYRYQRTLDSAACRMWRPSTPCFFHGTKSGSPVLERKARTVAPCGAVWRLLHPFSVKLSLA